MFRGLLLYCYVVPCAACSWFARWPCLALLAFVVTSIRVALFARRPACLRPPVRAARIAPRFTTRGRGVSDCIHGPWHWSSRLALVALRCIAFRWHSCPRYCPHKPGPICPLSNPHARPVEGGGLNSSPELAAYTPASPIPSSTGGLVPAPRLQSPAPGRGKINLDLAT
jgi:hypothetical protein